MGNTCITENELQQLLESKSLPTSLFEREESPPLEKGDEGGFSEPDTEPPTIELLGNNPAEVPLNSAFVDPGVIVHDNVTEDFYIVVETKVDGESQINTSIPGESTITYTATDLAGNSATAERVVNVMDTASSLTDITPPADEEETGTSTPPVA